MQARLYHSRKTSTAQRHDMGIVVVFFIRCFDIGTNCGKRSIVRSQGCSACRAVSFLTWRGHFGAMCCEAYHEVWEQLQTTERPRSERLATASNIYPIWKTRSQHLHAKLKLSQQLIIAEPRAACLLQPISTASLSSGSRLLLNNCRLLELSLQVILEFSYEINNCMRKHS